MSYIATSFCTTLVASHGTLSWWHGYLGGPPGHVCIWRVLRSPCT